MLKTQKVCWWRRGPANTEGKLGKEPDGEMGSCFFGVFANGMGSGGSSRGFISFKPACFKIL